MSELDRTPLGASSAPSSAASSDDERAYADDRDDADADTSHRDRLDVIEVVPSVSDSSPSHIRDSSESESERAAEAGRSTQRPVYVSRRAVAKPRIPLSRSPTVIAVGDAAAAAASSTSAAASSSPAV